MYVLGQDHEAMVPLHTIQGKERMRSMKKRIYALIMALTLASVFTGCGSDNSASSKSYAANADSGAYYKEGATSGETYYDDNSYGDYASEEYEMSDGEYDSGSGMSSTNHEEKGEDSAGDEATTDRSAELKRILQEKLVYNYNLSFYVMDENINDIVSDVEDAVKRFDGFVEFSNQSDDYFSATVRIPTMSRDSFVEAVSEGRDPKGYKLDKSVSNLSSAYTDYKNNYEIAKSNYEAYSAVLAQAYDVDDILKITQYVNQAKSEMDYYTRLMNDIDTDVSYSTIVISISVKETTYVPEPEDLTFGQKMAMSFESGLDDFIDGMQGLAIWFVGNIFGLIIFGIIVLIIVLIIRGIIKKNRAREAAQAEAYNRSREEREKMIMSSVAARNPVNSVNAANNTNNVNAGKPNGTDANSEKQNNNKK